jgi:hypothetical protein
MDWGSIVPAGCGGWWGVSCRNKESGVPRVEAFRGVGGTTSGGATTSTRAAASTGGTTSTSVTTSASTEDVAGFERPVASAGTAHDGPEATTRAGAGRALAAATMDAQRRQSFKWGREEMEVGGWPSMASDDELWGGASDNDLLVARGGVGRLSLISW